MSNNNNDENRVLGRMGARKVTEKELDRVAGGIVPTLASDLGTGPASNPDCILDT
jgi:hypothetical protein